MDARSAALVLILAALTTGPEAEAKSPDPLAGTTKAALAGFADDVAAAQRVLAAAAASVRRDYASGARSQLDAASTYAAAYVYFATQVKIAADDASAAAATAMSDALVEVSDPSLRGALAGDGGDLDRFGEAIQRGLDVARARALKDGRAFAGVLAKGSPRTQMNVVVPTWTFERRAAPAIPAPVPPEQDQPRLLAAVAVLTEDGHVVAAASGRAPAGLSGNFDVRLLARTGTFAVGPFLADGGVAVGTAGTWTVNAVLNEPTQGESVAPGNHVVAFGVDPFDGGLAGRQPGRLVHGGVIGIP